MAYLRDAFAAVTIAAELGAAWMWFGPQHASLTASLLTVLIGGGSVLPFVFFGQRVHRANADLQELRAAQTLGRAEPLQPLGAPSTRSD
jgi:hypothetical protein